MAGSGHPFSLPSFLSTFCANGETTVAHDAQQRQPLTNTLLPPCTIGTELASSPMDLTVPVQEARETDNVPSDQKRMEMKDLPDQRCLCCDNFSTRRMPDLVEHMRTHNPMPVFDLQSIEAEAARAETAANLEQNVPIANSPNIPSNSQNNTPDTADENVRIVEDFIRGKTNYSNAGINNTWENNNSNNIDSKNEETFGPGACPMDGIIDMGDMRNYEFDTEFPDYDFTQDSPYDLTARRVSLLAAARTKNYFMRPGRDSLPQTQLNIMVRNLVRTFKRLSHDFSYSSSAPPMLNEEEDENYGRRRKLNKWFDD